MVESIPSELGEAELPLGVGRGESKPSVSDKPGLLPQGSGEVEPVLWWSGEVAHVLLLGLVSGY
jgi:hypothetical protein